MANRCDFRTGDCIDRFYHVDKILGEGGFGQVFRVKTEAGQTYALKLLKLWDVRQNEREEYLKRCKLEYETGQIKSNYLVHSFALGDIEGNPYIVMEYCPNGDLQQYVHNNQADFVKISREILYGLRDLHQEGKVHRDLKPENVLIREDGTAVLTDFGISGDRAMKITVKDIAGNPKNYFGTILYMPPEQLKPKKDVTKLPTIDIFAFGVTMYYLITGIFPFGMLNDENDYVRYTQRAQVGEWNRDTLKSSRQGAVFYDVIDGCLQPDFRKRLQSADAVLSLLSSGVNHDYRPTNNKSVIKAVNGLLLRIMQGEDHGKSYRLNEMPSIITVGRQDPEVKNMIAIRETTPEFHISRRHCILEHNSFDGQWYVRDGQWNGQHNGWIRSVNGTFVNSTVVAESGIAIHPGDIISIGDAKLRVEGY